MVLLSPLDVSVLGRPLSSGRSVTYRASVSLDLIGEGAVTVAAIAAAVSARASARSVQLNHRLYVYGEPVASGQGRWRVTLHNDGPGTATEVICSCALAATPSEWSQPIGALQPGEIHPPSDTSGVGFSFTQPQGPGRRAAPTVEVQFGSITGARWRVITSRDPSTTRQFAAQRVRLATARLMTATDGGSGRPFLARPPPSRQSTSTFAVDEPEFVAGMIRAAFNAHGT
jgi:hypothetical protein